MTCCGLKCSVHCATVRRAVQCAVIGIDGQDEMIKCSSGRGLDVPGLERQVLEYFNAARLKAKKLMREAMAAEMLDHIWPNETLYKECLVGEEQKPHVARTTRILQVRAGDWSEFENNTELNAKVKIGRPKWLVNTHWSWMSSGNQVCNKWWQPTSCGESSRQLEDEEELL